MNYGQFLQMLPEATLVLALIIVFFADLILGKGKKKVQTLGTLMTVLLVAQLVACALAAPAEAFGGLYVATKATQVMKVILTFGTLLVTLVAQSWLEREAEKLVGEFHMLVLSTLLGMYVMMSSGNFLLFFLGLEMASVPMACLVAFDKYKNRSAEAAAKFVLTAVFSSGIMLYGISLLYGTVGTLYFGDVAERLQSFFAGGHNPSLLLAIVGLVFFFSGLAFKLSLVPFHFWTADTYQGAPVAVTGYLSVVSKGAAAFALLVVLSRALTPLTEYWEYLLYIVIVLSITIANLFAIRQTELKRFMAFSSISQAGYIMLAVIGATQMGMASLMYYVLVYVVANMAVFAVINTVEQRGNGTTMMSAYNGLYQTNPRLAFLMTLALFSLAGIPPFAGMFSKFFVFMAAAQQGSFLTYFVVFIALINTVVSLYYYLLIVKAMYINKSETPLPCFRTDCATRLALVLTIAGIALFGICSCIFDGLFAVAA